MSKLNNNMEWYRMGGGGMWMNDADDKFLAPEEPKALLEELARRLSYRQVNADKKHRFPVGSLVELSSGVRAFVVHQGRDCDMTPLYYLSLESDGLEPGFWDDKFNRMKSSGGYGEGSLKLIRCQNAH